MYRAIWNNLPRLTYIYGGSREIKLNAHQMKTMLLLSWTPPVVEKSLLFLIEMILGWKNALFISKISQ